jgi:lysophospholipase L1-like esterase
MVNRFIHRIIVLVVLCTSCGGSDTANAYQTAAQLSAQYQAGQQVVVGVIGNSHGCGYYADGAIVGGADAISPTLTGTGQTTSATQLLNVGGWPQKLQLFLRQKNATSIVQNLSGSGWTVENHLGKGTVAAMAAMTPKPTTVFIPLQINDLGKDSHNFNKSGGCNNECGFTYAEYVSNMYTLVQQVITAGMTPVLVKEVNIPFGWYWLEWEYVGDAGPANPGNPHLAYSTYISAMDTIANDATWVSSALGRHLDVIDTYTPTLNTGQESVYVYDTYRQGGTTNPTHDLTAPADYRYSLSDGWMMWQGSPYFDPLHPNQAGHDIILSQYECFLTGENPPSSKTTIMNLGNIINSITAINGGGKISHMAQ